VTDPTWATAFGRSVEWLLVSLAIALFAIALWSRLRRGRQVAADRGAGRSIA
jgi:hypothetical protein